MRIWGFDLIVAAACVAAFAPAAHAGVISGTYTGVVSSGRLAGENGNPLQDITGVAVTGAFLVDTTNNPDPFLIPGGSITGVRSLTLTYDFPSLNILYSSYPLESLVTSTDDGTNQSVLLEANMGDSAVLTGPESSLFNNVGDVGSLHAGSGVVFTDLTTRLNSRTQGLIRINVTNATFNTEVPIPEPAGWTLLAMSLAAMATLKHHGTRLDGGAAVTSLFISDTVPVGRGILDGSAPYSILWPV